MLWGGCPGRRVIFGHKTVLRHPSRALKDAQMADVGTFLDMDHFLGRVESLNLFLRHVITSVDVVKGLEEAIHNKSL